MDENQEQIRNPYKAGPVVSGNDFFGRGDVFQRIRQTLVTSQQRLVVVHGQRRIGKSSILEEFPLRLKDEDFVIVKFDLQFYAGRHLPRVLHALADAISIQFALSRPNYEAFEEDEFYFERSFLSSIKTYLKPEQRLLILIDEFDIMKDKEHGRVPVASPEFASALQALINGQESLSFVLIAGSNLAALPEYMQAVFKLGPAIRVVFLSRDETKRLIEAPVLAQNQLTYSEAAVDRIFSLTSGHPFVTQLLCSEIFNQVIFPEGDDFGRDVESKTVDAAVQKALISGTGAFSWVWNELKLAERIYLSAIALTVSRHNRKSVSTDEIETTLADYSIHLVGVDLPDAVNDLVTREFVEKIGASHYRFTVELFRGWVVKEYSLDNIKQDIENINPTARREFELARESHLSGDLPTAIKHYQKAARLNRNHARAQIGLAQALLENEEWAQAVDEFEKARMLDEANAISGLVEAFTGYGKALEKAGKKETALKTYRQALSYAPGNRTIQGRIDRLDRPGLFKRLLNRFRKG